MWLWVYYTKIPISSMFYLLKGNYIWSLSWVYRGYAQISETKHEGMEELGFTNAWQSFVYIYIYVYIYISVGMVVSISRGIPI